MVEPLNYFSFQPVLHDWYKTKTVLSCLSVKEPLMLIGKSSPSSGGSGFPLSPNSPLPHDCRYKTLNKMC